MRIVCNVITGEVTQVPLTQEELDDAAARTAALLEYNNLDNRAARDVDSKDRLLFEVLFNQENRIRVLEGKQPISKAVYRNALIDEYKRINS